MKLSKEQKKARDNLERFSRAIWSQFAFHRIKTFNDLLLAAGHKQSHIDSIYFPSEKNNIVTRDDVREYLSDRFIELTTKQYLENNPPDLNEYNKIQERPSANQSNLQESNTKALRETNTQGDKELKESGKAVREGSKDVSVNLREGKKEILEGTSKIKHYKLPPSKRQTCKLKDFQERNAAIILAAFVGVEPENLVEQWDNIKNTATLDIEKIKRAILLLAGVGVGKTYMYGAVMCRLIDIVYHKKLGSISPWPYIIVTKASIVEQTQRVMSNQFGIKVPSELLVINIDQLRSKFGELFVNEEEVTIEGEPHIKWTWRPYINPVVVFWDECQILKNAN